MIHLKSFIIMVLQSNHFSRVGGELIASLEDALSFLIYPATR